MLKEMLIDLIDKWEEKAKETATQADDILVKVLKALMMALL